MRDGRKQTLTLALSRGRERGSECDWAAAPPHRHSSESWNPVRAAPRHEGPAPRGDSGEAEADPHPSPLPRTERGSERDWPAAPPHRHSSESWNPVRAAPWHGGPAPRGDSGEAEADPHPSPLPRTGEGTRARLGCRAGRIAAAVPARVPWEAAGGSSSVVERLLAKEEVAGSTPVSAPPRIPRARRPGPPPPLEGAPAPRDAGHRAEVAELADATVSNTVGVHPPCGFESHLRHQCSQRFPVIAPRPPRSRG